MFIRLLSTSIFLFSFVQGDAQHFSVEAGLGIGGNFEKKFPGCNKKDKGRLVAQVALYYTVNKAFSLGIEASGSGRLFSIVGGSGLCNTYEAGSNTRTLNYNNLPSSVYLFVSRYSFFSSSELKPFVQLGIGTNNIYYKLHANNAESVSHTSFAISPGIGAAYKNFNFACKAILGGKTPSFSGFDTNTNENLVLTSISSQQLYITLGYRLFSF